MAIEVLSDIKKAGVGAFIPQQFFVQPTQPASTGMPYVWIQTGLPNGGVTVWYHDGVA